MAKLTRLGDLERAVMDHLWSTPDPQTVRQVHEALSARRDLAYTTIMTVLQRLAKKNLVSQLRDDRAHRYAPVHGRDELVAGLMVDALAQAEDSGEDRPRWCISSSVSAPTRPMHCAGPSRNWKQLNAIRRQLALLRRSEGDWQRVCAGLHHPRGAAGRSGTGPVSTRDVAIARPARRDGVVAGRRAGRGAFRVQRRHRDRHPATHARPRWAAHRQHHRRRRPARLAAVDGIHRGLRADRAGRCPADDRRGAGRHRQSATACPPPHGRRPGRGRPRCGSGSVVRKHARPARPGRPTTACQPSARCAQQGRGQRGNAEDARRRRSLRHPQPRRAHCAPATTWFWKRSPRRTPLSRDSSAAPTR